MLKYKLIGLAVAVKSLLINTFHPAPKNFEANHGLYRVTRIATISDFAESSGLETYGDSLLLTHKDSGGDSDLFSIDLQGTIGDTLVVQAKNRDWEDITQNDQGSYYIGDFGNNLNRRKNLVIYKYTPGSPHVEEIRFSFKDQQAFPPDRDDMNYDVEAMCWANDQLHLFTKNRGKKQVKHYILPDRSGEYHLQPVESTYLPNLITGADMNSAASMLALCSYGRIFLFKITEGGNFFDHPFRSIRFVRGAQAEGIVFINDKDFIVSNETGALFLFRYRR